MTNRSLQSLSLFPDTAPGQVFEIEEFKTGLRCQFEHPHGRLYQGDSIEWLASLTPESVDLIFADPPYNLKKAEWDNFESQEAYINWSMQWIGPASRALKPTGSLYICGFSEILADIKHPASRYFTADDLMPFGDKTNFMFKAFSDRIKVPLDFLNLIIFHFYLSCLPYPESLTG